MVCQLWQPPMVALWILWLHCKYSALPLTAAADDDVDDNDGARPVVVAAVLISSGCCCQQHATLVPWSAVCAALEKQPSDMQTSRDDHVEHAYTLLNDYLHK